jgi:DNA-binding MurR/RpiR family transcriptional regulator
MTRSERGIASYMLHNSNALAFENAATIAAKVGVSSMTVGRFLRSIGYMGFGELKEELRQSAAPGLLVANRLQRLEKAAGDGVDLRTNLQLEVNALVAVYEYVDTPLWHRTTRRLATSDQVHVAGFQTLSGLAADFAARLQYLRPGVSTLDGSDGTFAELFAGKGKKPCLVLVEMRRYTKFSRLLADQCREQGIPMVLICDTHCRWARDCTDDVFVLNTESQLFWDSQSPFMSLSNLLLDAVARLVRDKADTRLKRLGTLQDRFGAFGD